MKKFAEKYLEIINSKYQGLNLTRIKDPQEFYYKQVLDSILPLEESPLFKSILQRVEILVDIGFGGGFPLLPLAYKYPSYKFIGIDSTKKKVLAVKEIAKMFHMEHVNVHHQRYENLLFDKEVVLTFKAVAKISDILPKLSFSTPMVVFFYKGPHFEQKESIDSVLNKWELIEKREIKIPNTEGRILLGFKSKGSLNLGQKNLVKLKELL